MLESMTKMVAFKNDSVRIVAMLIAMGAAMILMATAVRILAGMDLKGAVVGLAAMKILMMTMQELDVYKRQRKQRRKHRRHLAIWSRNP